MGELPDEMLLALKVCQRFLARHQPMVDSDTPILGEVADQFDNVRSYVKTVIEKAEKVRQAEGLAPLALTEEQYRQALSLGRRTQKFLLRSTREDDS